MAFTRFKFKKNWTNASDFPTIRHDESEVRKDMQALHDEAKTGLNTLMGELEAPAAAGSIGAVDADGNDSRLQDALNRLAELVDDVTIKQARNLSASKISVATDLADKFGLSGTLAPKVDDVLLVLSVLAGKKLDELAPLVEAVQDLSRLAREVEPLLQLSPAAPYQDYWWRYREDASKYKPIESGDIKCTDYSKLEEQGAFVKQSRSNYSEVSAKIEYGTGVAQDASGKLYLTGDKGSVTFAVAKGSVANNADEAIKVLRGKYVKTPAGFFLKVPADATRTYRVKETQAYFWATPVRYVVPNNPARAWSDTHDPSATKYPESGFASGNEYRRVGVPLDAAVRRYAPAAGQYTGTGGYGSYFENVLNLWFDPAFVIIYGDSDFMLLVNSPTGATCLKTTSTTYGLGYNVTVSIKQGRVAWSSTYSASSQGNTKGKTYKYLAFA